MSKTRGFRAELISVLQVLAPDKAAYVNLSKENSKTKRSHPFPGGDTTYSVEPFLVEQKNNNTISK